MIWLLPLSHQQCESEVVGVYFQKPSSTVCTWGCIPFQLQQGVYWGCIHVYSTVNSVDVMVYPFSAPAGCVLRVYSCLQYSQQCGREGVSLFSTSRVCTEGVFMSTVQSTVWTWGCIPFQCQQGVYWGCIHVYSTVNSVDVSRWPFTANNVHMWEGLLVWTSRCILVYTVNNVKVGVLSFPSLSV